MRLTTASVEQTGARKLTFRIEGESCDVEYASTEAIDHVKRIIEGGAPLFLMRTSTGDAALMAEVETGTIVLPTGQRLEPIAFVAAACCGEA